MDYMDQFKDLLHLIWVFIVLLAPKLIRDWVLQVCHGKNHHRPQPLLVHILILVMFLLIENQQRSGRKKLILR